MESNSCLIKQLLLENMSPMIQLKQILNTCPTVRVILDPSFFTFLFPHEKPPNVNLELCNKTTRYFLLILQVLIYCNFSFFIVILNNLSDEILIDGKVTFMTFKHRTYVGMKLQMIAELAIEFQQDIPFICLHDPICKYVRQGSIS